MIIEFPFGEYWQPLENFVGFRAMVDNERLDCHMAQKALVRYFKGKGKDPLVVFKANRKAIEEVARKMIQVRKTDTEGPMAMGVDDFKR